MPHVHRVEVHRVAVRLLDPDGDRVLGSGWLWHGRSADDTMAEILHRLGIPAEDTLAQASRLLLRSVVSVPRRSLRHPVLLHVLTVDYVASPGLRDVVTDPRGQPIPGADALADEDLLVEVLAAYADGGRADPLGGQAGREVMRIQRPGAYAVLAHEGRVLLSQLHRSARWTLPGGGIDLGEQPEVSVVREVYEETGLPFGGVRLAGVSTARWTGRAPDHVVEDFQAVQFLYTGMVPVDVAPQVVEVDGSTSAVEWVPFAEAANRTLTQAAHAGLAMLGVATEPL